ncbi:MAG: TolC family protein [Bacteroidales bacterium]|nr:TolC family protein [Bacteroidales bacterium]
MKKLFLMMLIPLWLILPEVKSQQQPTDSTVRYFSLEEARLFAKENNYDVINALKDIESAREKVKETTAIGLPQISGSVAYNDFIDIPTQLIPAEFLDPTNPDLAGTFFPVKFGTKYNMNASATASMLLFSGEYIVGLQASRVFVDFSQKQYDKMVLQLDKSVAESYYMVLIAERNKVIIDSTLVSLLEIRIANEALYENGFIEDTDVDQVNLLISDLQATLINIDNNLSISKNLLKFTMGLKLENEIVLTDNLDDLLANVDKEVLYQTPFDYRKNIDYKILENQQELAYLDLKRYKSQYLPSLYTFFTFQENAYRQDWNFLKSGEEWYKTTLWGVQLDVPIFQSGARSAKVSQAKIQLDQLQVIDQKLRSGLEIQVSTVRNNFLNSWKVYQNKQQGLELSLRIYRKTQQKLLEGVSSSIELQQNYNQYLNGERDYVMSILDLLNNKLELEELLTEYKN